MDLKNSFVCIGSTLPKLIFFGDEEFPIKPYRARGRYYYMLDLLKPTPIPVHTLNHFLKIARKTPGVYSVFRFDQKLDGTWVQSW